MFTKEDIIDGMDGLGLETQVEVLESTLQEVGIADFADVLACAS